MNYPTVAELTAKIREEVEALIADGTVPAACPDFARLHDYVDANMLGESLWPELADDADDAQWDAHFEKMGGILSPAQDQVNAWLMAR
ncbi:hypothetical protein SEA_MAGUCO_46 [Arthrobacter phage MaGuCo]|uniref:Uncharacterized protein n=1 Tax=Arthrobacter phage MaGuCo TaxID=3038363 RepID=A0AAF0GFD7_9CAUD|nr:hypothetical protein SEA_MAGUCO_46 [Arthrobacter phage MaGuCo]